MAYDVSNFLDNDDVSVIAERGPFKVIQYDRDLSCTPEEAMTKYYMSQMYVTKKQLVCDTDKASVIPRPCTVVTRYLYVTMRERVLLFLVRKQCQKQVITARYWIL